MPTYLPYLLGALATVLAASLTGWLTYRSAKRQHSGTTATADAETIFQAAEQIRKELREELGERRAEVKGLRGEIAELTLRAEQCEKESEELNLKNDALANRIARLEQVHADAEEALHDDET